MSRDQELFEDEETSRGKIRGSHSGIAPDKVNTEFGGGSPDDEVIELVDVVREGNSLQDTIDTDELALLLDQAEETEKGEPFLEREGEEPDGFSLPLNETAQEDLESGLDQREDVLDDRFESPDFDFETPESFDEPAGKDVSEIPQEDLDEVMAGLVDEVEDETAEAATTDEEPHPVSPERLEAIITGAVTEVVERVVRETVAEVAERVIKEAIESLRQSLEPTPE